MAVAEPDDRDPGGEVEVAPAVVVDEPGAVALDERDVGARVGRQHGSVEDGVLTASTAVSPISARTPSRAARTAARSFGTIPPSNSPSSSSRSASSAPIDGTTPPSRARRARR